MFAWIAAALTVPGIPMAEEKPKAVAEGQTDRLQQRIDFGNAHIMGQSIKSGAVYLMHRKKSDIDSMLKVRQNYRAEIIEEFGLEDTALDTEKNHADHDLKKGSGR